MLWLLCGTRKAIRDRASALHGMVRMKTCQQSWRLRPNLQVGYASMPAQTCTRSMAAADEVNPVTQMRVVTRAA